MRRDRSPGSPSKDAHRGVSSRYPGTSAVEHSHPLRVERLRAQNCESVLDRQRISAPCPMPNFRPDEVVLRPPATHATTLFRDRIRHKDQEIELCWREAQFENIAH